MQIELQNSFMKVSSLDRKFLDSVNIQNTNEFDRSALDTSIDIKKVSSSSFHLHREHSNPQHVVQLFRKYENATHSMNESLKVKKICFKEWRILNEILLLNKANPKSISTQTNLTNSQISHYVNLLESKELVTRNYSEQYDRRTVQICITELGEDAWKFGIKCVVNLEI